MNVAVEVADAFRIYESGTGATVALQGLDLTLQEGEIVVVLGPSGAGKSTLLRVLAALDRLSAGAARAFGIELGDLSGAAAAAFRANHVGLLDQHYARSLSADLTCRHSVALQLELLGASPSESQAAADELLDRVGLLDRADDLPDKLSGGEQQRVAVCAAVAHRPGLLLADEPAGELDAENAEVVYGLLGSLVRGAGATALIVSHDAAAASIADRLVHIRDGRIVEQSLPGQKPALVISRRGWARLPHPSAAAGKARLAEVERSGGTIVVTELEPGEAVETVAAVSAPPEPGEVAASLDGVSKLYGRRSVLDQLTRDFHRGVFTGLVGRSGSGKTTVLHLLGGLERPDDGEVVVAGRRLGELDRAALAGLRRREVALVTQEPGLIPYLTALENVELGIRLRTQQAPSSAQAVEALAAVGLAERLDQRAANLSAGERERVAIARALASAASILLVDEPTARLDEENARAVGSLLALAAHERGLAVVCATHDPVLIDAMDELVTLGPAAAPAHGGSRELVR
jgi:ABC-type lipoprotein export system ATPase subunit